MQTHTETAVLTFYGSTKAQTINLVKTQGKIWVRKGGEVFHLPPERIQQISKNLKRLRLRNALSNLSPWAWKMGEIRVYRLSLEPAQDPPRQTTFKRDHLEDLLLYDEAGRSGHDSLVPVLKLKRAATEAQAERRDQDG